MIEIPTFFNTQKYNGIKKKNCLENKIRFCDNSIIAKISGKKHKVIFNKKKELFLLKKIINTKKYVMIANIKHIKKEK